MSVPAKSPKAPLNKLEKYDDIFDPERLAKRIAEGVDVNAKFGRPRAGRPPIQMAAERANVTIVRMLLAAGATPEWGNSERYSALTDACAGSGSKGESDIAEVCELLVSAGADPNGIPRERGRGLRCVESAVYCAAVYGRSGVVEKLHALGANIDAPCEDPAGHWNEAVVRTPLGWVLDSLANGNAATKELLNEATVVTLLRLGADEKCLEAGGVTPFQECVARGLKEVVEYYVRERGEDLAQRVNGRTLVQHARTPEMREFLKSLKVTLSVEDSVLTSPEGASAPAAVWGNISVGVL